MNIYTIFYSRAVLTKLRKQTIVRQKKVLQIFELIRNNPRHKGLNARKIATSKATYIVRIGNMRILYEINIKKRHVYILEFKIRGNIN